MFTDMAQPAEAPSQIELSLTDAELARLVEAADACVAAGAVEDAEEFASRALRGTSSLPQRVLDGIRAFRRHGSGTGGLLVRGCPTFDAPSTPRDPGAAVGARLRATGVFAVVSAVLGDHYGFRPELGGNIVQDIVPVPGFEHTQQSISSEQELHSHVESAFTDDRPDYVALFCLRPDHQGIAVTTLTAIRSVLPHLSPGAAAVLREPRFKTRVDASFLHGMGVTEPVYVGPIRVLTGSAERPRVRADFAETAGLDPAARAALAELKHWVDTLATPVRLRTGDLLFVDNLRSFHGRTPFRPRFDGADRWLLRMFLTRDLARSEAHRPHDGRIVDVGYTLDPAGATAAEHAMTAY